MESEETLHIVPAPGGGWAVRGEGDAGASSLHPTQSLAVAKAWEMVGDRRTAEVVVHGPDGAILSNLSIRLIAETSPDVPVDGDDAEDDRLRREAQRITPSRAKIDALIGRLPRSRIDYDAEDDDLPC